MKIALAVEGTRGDLQPMVALATRLRAAGHEPVMCASVDAREFVESRGIEFRPGGSDVSAYLEREARAVAGGGLSMVFAAHRYFDVAMEAQFRLLPEATCDVDLILGAGVQTAGASVAELHRVPYRFVAYCPAMLPSSDHAPVALPIHTLPRWMNLAMWGVFRTFYNAKLRRPLTHWRAQLGLGPERDVYSMFASPRPILACDAVLAPLGRDCPADVTEVGYLLPPDPTPMPEKLEAFLDAGPPPVYLGFGSMTDPHPERTTALLLEVVERLGCRALISRGWAGLGDVALPDDVFVLPAVDHRALFARTAAVVHHGGSGTTHTAARAGVPQLVVPHFLDQFYFGNRVRELGVGPPQLPRSALSGVALARRLSEVLGNEVMAERAADLGRRLCEREPLDTVVEKILAD